MDANSGNDLMMSPWAWVAYGLTVFYLGVVVKGLIAWRKELRDKDRQDKGK